MMDINNGTEIDDDSFDDIAAALGMSEIDIAVARFVGGSLSGALASKGYNIDLTNPINYFGEHISKKEIWRFILSHPDLDHMRGLVALRAAGYEIANFWDTVHNKVPLEFHQEGDKDEWAEYERLRSGTDNKALRLDQGDEGQYFNRDESGNAPGDGINLLGPIPSITTAENAKDSPNFNNLSYVLAIDFGGRRMIFGGDAEEAVWDNLRDTFGDKLKCDVLIAPHHGRESAYHDEAVAAMSPAYTIVSVGKKPDTDASNKYRKHSQHVWSTRWRGNITIELGSDGSMAVTPQYERSGFGSSLLGSYFVR